jgi:hypothetical protein
LIDRQYTRCGQRAKPQASLAIKLLMIEAKPSAAPAGRVCQQHQQQENHDRHHDGDGRDFSPRCRRLPGRAAGLTVRQKPENAILIAIRHDPHRQQHRPARQIGNANVDMHVASLARDILLASRALEFLEALIGQRPGVFPRHGESLERRVDQIDLFGRQRWSEIEWTNR